MCGDPREGVYVPSAECITQNGTDGVRFAACEDECYVSVETMECCFVSFVGWSGLLLASVQSVSVQSVSLLVCQVVAFFVKLQLLLRFILDHSDLFYS